MGILKPVLIGLLVLMAVLIIIKANSFVTDDSQSKAPAPESRSRKKPVPPVPGGSSTRLAAAQFVIDYNGRTERIMHYPYTIGQRSDNDLVIQDATVSRHHAQIVAKQTQNGTAVLLQDLGSLNGTLVNGKPCHETRIVGGETLTLGQTKLVIRTAPTEVSDETMYVRRKF